MRYVSATADPDVRSELMSDLSGLVVGSAFLLSTPQQAERLLKLCDDAAKAAYDKTISEKRPAGVECITLDAGGLIGFNSLKAVADLPDDAVVVPVYRYFDTPRENIVGAAVAAPSSIKKTREVTFFCGPDRRKTGDYRIFSIHPGPRRHPFPSRYQPEKMRRENRNYWDRHVFLTTPNQILATKIAMRTGYKDLEPEARDRVFHMTRQMEVALHRFYGTYDQMEKPEDIRALMSGEQKIGNYTLGPDGAVYYFTSLPGTPPPDLMDPASLEPLLDNSKRPAVIRPDGTEEYYIHGKRHRVDGPALIQPQPDGGWMEVWYENGLVSRLPDDGPAKIVYDAKGDVIQEVSIYKGAEVEAAALGQAAETIQVLQAQIKQVGMSFKWYEEMQDFSLLRGQLDLAASRTRQPIDKIVRQMQAKDEQVGLRWDFDRTLEQDPVIKAGYTEMAEEIKKLGAMLIEGSQAMRFVRGDPNIVNGIWGKVLRDTDRLIERGKAIPAISEGKTMADDILQAREESRKYFSSLADQARLFSATGR